MDKRLFLASDTKLHIPDVNNEAMCHWPAANGKPVSLTADEYQGSDLRVCQNCAAVWRSMHNGHSYIATVMVTSYRWVSHA